MSYLFINYLLSIIIYEEATRTETNYPEFWTDDFVQCANYSFIQ